MDKPRQFQRDTFHHLYNRGANKLNILFDENDYNFFIKRMKEYKSKYSIEILTYCLMPNHFHLFIHQTTAQGSVSKFISDLTNSYTKTFNKKYCKTGIVFESRTKSKIIYDEAHFTNVAKYILLNPVRAGLVKTFHEWKYSSAEELLTGREIDLTDKLILKYFVSVEKFKEFIETDNVEEFEGIRKYLI